MNIYIKIILGFIITVLLLIVIGLSNSKQIINTDVQTNTLGGLLGDPFTYKNTSTFASSTNTVATLVRGGAGVVHAITILTTSAHTIKLYDSATSATTSATIIGAFPASAVVGPYDLDVAFTKGLVVELQSGYAGSAVVSYK